jgi:hypothetical protein
LLAPLDADERAAFLDNLAHRASPSFDFFLFSLLAGIVIGIGLLFDKSPLLVLGAVLAPVMAPIVGLSLGAMLGSFKLFIRSFAGLLIGSLLVFVIGALLGLVARLWLHRDFNLAHFYAQVSWINFLVLAIGALLTAVAMTRTEPSSLVSSVAIAYELYIPLTVAGFGLTSGVLHLWPDGLVIYVVYMAWAALLGALTLLILGFRPLTPFGYTLGGTLTLLGIIALIELGGVGTAVGTGVGIPTPVPTHTATFTPVPTITLTVTRTRTPVPPTVTPVAPTLTETPAPTLTQTPTLTFTPTPMYARVYAMAGGGAKLRDAPGGDTITSLLNDTLVMVFPDYVEENGSTWAHVMVVANSQEGWILQSLLIMATPAPGW